MHSWFLRSGMALVSLGGLLSAGALAGCEATVYPAHPAVVRDDYVYDAPPPPQRDVVVGVAPGPDYVWVGGHWWRDRGRWVWVGGHWDRRPYARAHWEPGRWEHRCRGYVWVEGRWR